MSVLFHGDIGPHVLVFGNAAHGDVHVWYHGRARHGWHGRDATCPLASSHVSECAYVIAFGFAYIKTSISA
jgi:hypothetical protein